MSGHFYNASWFFKLQLGNYHDGLLRQVASSNQAGPAAFASYYFGTVSVQASPWPVLFQPNSYRIEEETYQPSGDHATPFLAFQHVLATPAYPFWSLAYVPAKFVEGAEEIYSEARGANQSELLNWLNNQSTPITPPPPPAVTPPAAGGGVSGRGRRRRGPIKREDQVFGETYAVSPFLSSRLKPKIEPPVELESSHEDHAAVIAALMRELL